MLMFVFMSVHVIFVGVFVMVIVLLMVMIVLMSMFVIVVMMFMLVHVLIFFDTIYSNVRMGAFDAALDALFELICNTGNAQ